MIFKFFEIVRWRWLPENVENKNKIKVKMLRINYVSYGTYHSTEARERVSKEFFFDLSGVSFILFDFFFFIHGKSGNSMYTKQH